MTSPLSTSQMDPPMLDMATPHSARRYDYWLGGKEHFAADRESGDRIAAAFPTIRTAAIENRRFLQRAVRFLVEEAGVRQFLEIGTGFPTAPNVHQIAQAVDPAARIVYVDNDAVVAAHARALMVSTPEGQVRYVHADLRQPDTILADPVLHATLDLTKPVGLLLIAVLHFLDDDATAHHAVDRLVNALPEASFVALSHFTLDPLPADTARRLTALADPAAGHGPFRPRTHAEIAALLHRGVLIDPGLVPIVDWQPTREPQPAATMTDTAVYGGITWLP